MLDRRIHRWRLVLIAKETLDAVAKGKYIILPGSEGKLMFLAQNLLGRGLYPVMDMMVNSAIKKLRFGINGFARVAPRETPRSRAIVVSLDPPEFPLR